MTTQYQNVVNTIELCSIIFISKRQKVRSIPPRPSDVGPRTPHY